MIDQEFIKKIRYPNEEEAGFDDRIDFAGFIEAFDGDENWTDTVAAVKAEWERRKQKI